MKPSPVSVSLSQERTCFQTDVLLDDAAIYDGAHVSVQLIGRRLQEEKVLALAEYVGDAIRGS
jgi:hypothetical protein